MPTDRTTTHPPRIDPPRIDPLRLGALADGDPADLTRNADLESVRFGELTLPHLDLTGARVATVQLTRLSADETDLKGARLFEVALDQVNLPVVRAARSQWRDVHVAGRVGSLEAYDAQWRAVRFTGCKLSFVNLRAAELTDLELVDCVVEELDLVDARARRLRLSGTRVGRLDLQRAELHDVDLRGATLEAVDGLDGLRGATISPEQLTLLAPLLAASLGLRVEG